MVLEHGITIGGKTIREHLEVRNVVTAWQTLEAWVHSSAPLTEDILKNLHRLTMPGILDEDIGSYRTEFAAIHPFIDGNGRVSRLLVNA